MTTLGSRIGWIGTGRMGHAMATLLLKAGEDVTAWNRTRSKADDLGDLGGTVVDSVRDLADRDVVFTMVAADADLLAVTVGPGGVLDGDVTPRYLVDSSTVSSETSATVRKAAEAKGTVFLAAPVSGNAKVVKAGRLSIAVSGPRDAYDEVEPLLALMGHSVTYVGEGEVARLVKLAHNIFLGVVIQSLSEITVLAESGGVTRSAFLEFMNDSVMGSVFTRYKSPALVNLDYTPTFTPVLLRKDFDLGLAAARGLDVPMPVAALTAQLVQASVSSGRVGEDFSILLDLQAASAGLEMKPENIAVDDGLASGKRP
ncbi:NAD(P)-dependent oxidoreductase [Acidothermaceae bacterium B102]|nr:NAD(P)-dependent oxidoreductase [Acidothermaceae bacterium B102]